jgi:alpha-tubulin suppressor-like RCC1 family protein
MPLRDPRHLRPAARARIGRPGLTAAAGGLAAALATVPAIPAAASATAPAAAAAKKGNFVLAWGSSANGELGNGTTTSTSTPVFAKVPSNLLYTTVRSSLTSVALTTTGRVYGWGNNNAGQVGDGTTANRLTPVRATKLNGVKVTAVRESALFTMVLTSAGRVLSWGMNTDGELGNGTTKDRLSPVRARLPRGVTITAISAGYNSALALTKSGRILAWGDNTKGQLGDGTKKDRHAPVYVQLPAHTTVKSLATGYETGYAVTSTGRLLAWGFNAVGELGDGTATDRLKPVQAHLPKGVKVSSATGGELHALALTTTGRVLAWGFNQTGQLGDGSTTNRLKPLFVKLHAGTRVRALAGGQDFSMALTRGGRILTWGANGSGQLGNGTTTDSATPVTVHLPPGFRPTAIGAGWFAQTGLAIGQVVV